MSSKLNGELVTKAVEDILAYSAGETIKKGDAEVVGKKRKFTESIELQVRRADLLYLAHCPLTNTPDSASPPLRATYVASLYFSCAACVILGLPLFPKVFIAGATNAHCPRFRVVIR